MTFADVLSTLDITDAAEALAVHAEQELVSLAPGETPRFLDPANISRAREFALLPDAADPALHEAARQITASPELLHFTRHCHRLLYEHLDYPGGSEIRQWPHPIAAMGDLSGALYLLIALDAVPRMRALHRKLGIPEEISRATCSHYPVSLHTYQQHHNGQYGFAPRVLYWVRNHSEGDLYRLGRLEYMLKPFNGPLMAFRHRQSREVVALAVDGTRFDDTGFLALESEPECWCAQLVQTEESITGTSIAPCGLAENCQVELSLTEWERALAPGDAILEVHIPAGGDMTPERCRASMQQALEFFPRYFPDRGFAGFACRSWILNPQLAEIYRPDSNMVLWQRELYLFPAFGGRGSLYFVFGKDDVDIATAPRDTSLRRALLDHLAAGGGLMRGGGMFMLNEDFPQFGSQVYRRG